MAANWARYLNRDLFDPNLNAFESDNGFFTLLGNAQGNSTVDTLLDHKAEIGYRTVERVCPGRQQDLLQRKTIDGLPRPTRNVTAQGYRGSAGDAEDVEAYK